jgi:protein aurora borealis
MKPVHLEPHDTQFQTPQDYDSETEARAQAAIITYFNEHEIVPSPIDCQLRNQKLVLAEELMETSSLGSLSLGKAKKKQSADGSAQTILTFPPILPKSVEDLLRPYFSYTAVSDLFDYFHLRIGLTRFPFIPGPTAEPQRL